MITCKGSYLNYVILFWPILDSPSPLSSHHLFLYSSPNRWCSNLESNLWKLLSVSNWQLAVHSWQMYHHSGLFHCIGNQILPHFNKFCLQQQLDSSSPSSVIHSLSFGLLPLPPKRWCNLSTAPNISPVCDVFCQYLGYFLLDSSGKTQYFFHNFQHNFSSVHFQMLRGSNAISWVSQTLTVKLWGRTGGLEVSGISVQYTVQYRTELGLREAICRKKVNLGTKSQYGEVWPNPNLIKRFWGQNWMIGIFC